MLVLYIHVPRWSFILRCNNTTFRDTIRIAIQFVRYNTQKIRPCLQALTCWYIYICVIRQKKKAWYLTTLAFQVTYRLQWWICIVIQWFYNGTIRCISLFVSRYTLVYWCIFTPLLSSHTLYNEMELHIHICIGPGSGGFNSKEYITETLLYASHAVCLHAIQ